MRTTILVALILAPLTGCFPIEGFSSAKPETNFTVRTPAGKAVSFSDSKDNDVLVEGMLYNPQTGEFKIDKLSIRNNSSDVRDANARQTAAWVPLAQVNWQGLTQFTTATFVGLSNLADSLQPLQFASVLKSIPKQQTISTPYGEMVTQSGLTAEQVATLYEKVLAKTVPPATKPAEGPQG